MEESGSKRIDFDLDMSMRFFHGSRNRKKSQSKIDEKTKALLLANTPEVNPTDFDKKSPPKRFDHRPLQKQ